MDRHSIRVASIAGIDIRVHATWLALFTLVTWSLAAGYYPAVLGSDAGPLPWVLGMLSALLLFASVLAHELAHSLVARAGGLDVHSITLFLFGGISDLASEPSTPRNELLVAVVGPLASLAIGLAFVAAAAAAPERSTAEAILGYAAVVNLLLGTFNLMPGFPLDGGRALHAVAWRLSGSPERAMRIASGSGRAAGVLMMLGGAWMAVSGALLDGVWLGAIGWFLQGAAGAALDHLLARERLGGVTVADAMARDPATAGPGESAASVLMRLDDRRRAAVAVAVGLGGEPGFVTAADLRAIPRDRRPWTRVADVMRSPSRAMEIAPGQPLVTALDELDRSGSAAAPIVEDGRVVGVLLRDDIVRFVELPVVPERPAA